MTTLGWPTRRRRLLRTYAMEKIAAYAGAETQPWQQGLSFDFINIHLQLLPDITTAIVPANTPIFPLSSHGTRKRPTRTRASRSEK